MGRVSKRYIHPEVEERIFEIFWKYLMRLKNPSEMQEFLTSLLSRTEQIMIAKRLAIAVLLRKGHTYEQIDSSLKVSKSTVGTVHKQILSGATGYTKAIERILASEKKENIWNALDEFILKITPPKAYGSFGWQQKSVAGKSLAKRKRQLSSL